MTKSKDVQPRDPKDMGGFRFSITNAELWDVRFTRLDSVDEDDNEDPKFNLELGVHRPAKDTVAIQLTAESEEGGAVEFRIACRIAISIVEQVDDAEIDYDAALRGAAARIGPVAAYPYIRQALADHSQRSGLSPIVLPVMNVGAMFDPTKIEFDSLDSEESDTEEAGP